jgi:hypothetical protein
LSAEQQALSFFLANAQNVNHTRIGIDVVQDAKAIIRAEADLPMCLKGRWLPQRFAVPGWYVRLEVQLFLHLGEDERVMLGVNCLQVLRDCHGIDQGVGLLPRHDDL